MSESEDPQKAFGEAFGRSADPLSAFEPIFEELQADPLAFFIEEELLHSGLKQGTIAGHLVTYQQWREYMDEVGRHPGCPAEEHVQGFARWLQEDLGNQSVVTIRQKLQKINRAYRFWQEEPTLPHTLEYDIVQSARNKIDWSEFEDTETKRPHPIAVEVVRERVRGITELLDYACILLQLKLGLRVGEVRNIRFSDLNISDEELSAAYPALGTHELVTGRHDVIYIPSKAERDGNKSTVGRLLPIDEEVHQILDRYLLIRPSVDDEHLFISQRHDRPSGRRINNAWKDAFLPKYGETDEYRAVTSHFGRHYFTTYWKKEQELPPELVQYMRGDRVGDPASDDSAMHHYLHTYYRDIEDRYRKEIYRLCPAEPWSVV